MENLQYIASDQSQKKLGANEQSLFYDYDMTTNKKENRIIAYSNLYWLDTKRRSRSGVKVDNACPFLWRRK